MGSTNAASAPETRATGTSFDRGAAVTRSLLGYGVIVGPLYLAAGVIQGFVRDGFSFERHPLSVLSNGTGGWVQTVNFALCGAMVIAAALGMARVPGPKLRTASWFLATFGFSMILASIFRADAMDGFPVGTPVGPPTSISAMGLMHFAVGALGFISLGVSCLITARAMSRFSTPSIARLSLFSGLSVLLGFFGGFALPVGTLGIWFAVVMGWAWLAVLSLHLYRVAPSPNCEAPLA